MVAGSPVGDILPCLRGFVEESGWPALAGGWTSPIKAVYNIPDGAWSGSSDLSSVRSSHFTFSGCN